METKLAQAQLESLKSQLQPHFLFNTLHTISGLMYEDPHAANKMIVQLSDLLRVSLDKSDSNETCLKDEIEFNDAYLQIQKTRFKGRLQIEMNIKPETLNAAVPFMLLQPLVENAVTHGIAPHKKGGKIRIAAANNNGRLVIEVHDNGGGMNSGKDIESLDGVGISNTIERLKQLYAKDHKFELNDSPDGGLEVKIDIPFKLYDKT
jgi:sensor histidine kinase YesM